MTTYYETELKHYGVLGMKWGQHKARVYTNKATKFNNKRYKLGVSYNEAYAKGNTRKANRIKAKQAKLQKKSNTENAKAALVERYHTNMAGSKKVYDSVKSQSTGKLAAKSLLMGTYGTLNYERAKAAGASKGKAAVAGLAAAFLNNQTGGLASIIEPRVSNDYKKKVVKEAGKVANKASYITKKKAKTVKTVVTNTTHAVADASVGASSAARKKAAAYRKQNA